MGGGGIHLHYSSASLSHNLIYRNSALFGGGGVIAQHSTFSLINNTISENECTTTSTSARGAGLSAYSDCTISGYNNIIYGNHATTYPDIYLDTNPWFDYSCCSQTLIGTGNITEDPSFADPDNDNYNLNWGSPCIDAGDPASPLDPDGTIADMGVFYYDQTSPPPQVTIELTPYGTPIQIPANGGSFDFNIALENSGSLTETLDIWAMITLPSGDEYGPIINASGISIGSGQILDRDRTQNIPAGAPPGMYTYDAYIGNYPNTVWSEDHFDFEKLETADGSRSIEGWECFGEPFDSSNPAEKSVPSEHLLLTAYPNPFNNRSVIGFTLESAGYVELSVFDITGREIGSLINGHLSPGKHEAVWNAEGIVSGVYFMRLHAGDVTRTRKLLLIK